MTAVGMTGTMTSALTTSSLLAAQAYGAGRAAGPQSLPAFPGPAKPQSLSQTSPSQGPNAGGATDRPEPSGAGSPGDTGAGARNQAVQLDLSPEAQRRLASAGAGPRPDNSDPADDRDDPSPRALTALSVPDAGGDIVVDADGGAGLGLPAVRREAPFAARDLDRPPPAPPGSTLDLRI